LQYSCKMAAAHRANFGYFPKSRQADKGTGTFHFGIRNPHACRWVLPDGQILSSGGMAESHNARNLESGLNKRARPLLFSHMRNFCSQVDRKCSESCRAEAQTFRLGMEGVRVVEKRSVASSWEWAGCKVTFVSGYLQWAGPFQNRHSRLAGRLDIERQKEHLPRLRGVN